MPEGWAIQVSVPPHRVRLAPFLAGLVDAHHGGFGSLLDLGCGELQRVWRQRWGAGYEGMDIRDSVGADHVGDACDLSRFPSDSRDVVTAWSVIEHVYRPYDMLCEMKRISKGTCILTTDYTERNKNNDPTHLYSWTEKTLRQLVKKVHHDCKVYVDKMMLIGVMYSCGEES